MSFVNENITEIGVFVLIICGGILFFYFWREGLKEKKEFVEEEQEKLKDKLHEKLIGFDEDKLNTIDTLLCRDFLRFIMWVIVSFWILIDLINKFIKFNRT